MSSITGRKYAKLMLTLSKLKQTRTFWIDHPIGCVLQNVISFKFSCHSLATIHTTSLKVYLILYGHLTVEYTVKHVSGKSRDVNCTHSNVSNKVEAHLADPSLFGARVRLPFTLKILKPH